MENFLGLASAPSLLHVFERLSAGRRKWTIFYSKVTKCTWKTLYRSYQYSIMSHFCYFFNILLAFEHPEQSHQIFRLQFQEHNWIWRWKIKTVFQPLVGSKNLNFRTKVWLKKRFVAVAGREDISRRQTRVHNLFLSFFFREKISVTETILHTH